MLYFFSSGRAEMSLIPNFNESTSFNVLLNPAIGYFYNNGLVVVPAGSITPIPITTITVVNDMTPLTPTTSSVTLNRPGTYRFNITCNVSPTTFTNLNYFITLNCLKNGVVISPSPRTTQVSRSGPFAFSTADVACMSAEWVDTCVVGDIIEGAIFVSAINCNVSTYSLTIQQIK